MIRGKKNFLPPHPLIMGFGLLFRMDESSLGSHLNERRVRREEEGMDDFEESGPFKENSDIESEKDVRDEKPVEEGLSVDNSAHTRSTHSTSRTIDSHEPLVEDKTILDDVDGKISDIAGNGTAPATQQLEDLIDRALVLGSASISSIEYGIETPKVDLVEEDNHEERKATVRDKPYVSKAERRKLKKGQGSSAAEAKVEHEKEKSKDVSSSQPGSSAKDKKPDGGKNIRGQRGKLKKMKEKYADQDEEERNIRMALLASAGKVQKNDGDSQNGNAATEKEKKPATSPEDALKVCYKCKKVGHLSKDCKEHPDNTSHGHANSRVEDNPPVGLDDTAGLDRVAMEEDDIHEIGEEERERLNEVDYLTGNPLPSDILLYAVPVCGPYSAVQSYKYRVKIIPGTAKKGKAAKTAMNLFSHMPEATSREKELMKACTDPELVAAIIRNVKVIAVGLAQLKQKKGKKTSKQES